MVGAQRPHEAFPTGKPSEEIVILAQGIARPALVEADRQGFTAADDEAAAEQAVGLPVDASREEASRIMEAAEVGEAVQAAHPG